MMFEQVIGDHFPVRLGRRHTADEPYDLSGQIHLSLSRQDFCDFSPSALDFLSGLDQRLLARLSS